MAGAADFMVGNAPAGAAYAAPLLNFSPIANYPTDYFQGQQRARTLALQKPVIDPNTGQPTTDVNQLMQAGAQRGGLDWLAPLMPVLLQGQMGQQGAAAIDGTDPRSPSAVPGASGPANIRGTQPNNATGALPPQPQLSTAGADNNGSDTLRSIAVESFGNRDVTDLIPRFAAALKVDPDAPLTAQQAAQVRSRLTQTAQNMPPNRASDATGAGAPVSPTGGVSGSPGPAPSSAAAGMAAAPAPTPGMMPGMTPGAVPTGAPPNPASALVPKGYDPNAYAGALTQRAEVLRAQAARYAAFPNGAAEAKVLQEQAQAYDDRAKQIFDALQKDTEPTPEQKNLATGATEQGEILKGRVTQSQKTYNGIQALAGQYETDLKPYLDLSRSILNDPNMYTGTGANLALDINRVRASLGNPTAAMLQEALQKVTASSVLGQINGQRDQLMEAGGTAGRIFAQQVDLVEKAAPQLSSTLGGNRFLVEVASRMGDLNTRVRDMAQQYMTPAAQGGMGHNYLDPGFDKMVADYLRAHPVFTKEELSKPALLGAPTAPQNIKTPADASAWASAMKLNKGDAIRTPNGYRYYQGPPQQAQAPAQ